MPKKTGKSKTINAYAVVDWKDGSVRTRQTKPKRAEMGTNELLAELEFNVSVPEVEIPTLAADIEVPEPMVRSATLEALDDEQLPDWSDTADEIIKNNPNRMLEVREGDVSIDEFERFVTLATLREAPGRPAIDHVEEYVSAAVGDMLDPGPEVRN